MDTKRVDDLVEATMFPGEGGEGEDPMGGAPTNPRFKWTPPTTPSAPMPPASTGRRKVPAKGPAQTFPAAPVATASGELDDRTGNVSINQLLGGSRFASKDDLWAASDRMRSKLGPGGAAKWAADYGQAEFEALAQKIVSALLEGTAEDEVKRVEKDTKKVANKADQTVTRWFHGLGSKKSKKSGQ